MVWLCVSGAVRHRLARRRRGVILRRDISASSPPILSGPSARCGLGWLGRRAHNAGRTRAGEGLLAQHCPPATRALERLDHRGVGRALDRRAIAFEHEPFHAAAAFDRRRCRPRWRCRSRGAEQGLSWMVIPSSRITTRCTALRLRASRQTSKLSALERERRRRRDVRR